MKLPFEFGIKLIFRLVFPGAILALALTPAVRAILDASGIWIKFEYLFPIEAVAFGWMIVISDMRIYMLFEGRRYWLLAAQLGMKLMPVSVAKAAVDELRRLLARYKEPCRVTA